MADVDLTIKATAETAAAKAAVADLNTEVAKTTVTQAGATAEALRGEAGLKALQEEIAATAAKAKALAGETEAAGKGTAQIGTAAATAAGPLALLLLAITLLPDILKKVADGSVTLFDKLVELAGGFGEEAEAARKDGESMIELHDRKQRVADAAAAMTRASIAVGAGLIEEGRNVDATRLAWEVYQRALHGTLADSAEVTKALADLGIKVPESLARIIDAANDLGLAFDRTLKGQGVEAARVFAEENRSRIDQVISRYQALGILVPEAIARAAAAIGILTKAEQDAAKELSLTKKYIDVALAVDGLLRRMPEYATALGSEGAAVLALQKEIEGHIRALEKLKTTNDVDEQSRLAKIDLLKNLLAAEGALTEGIAAEEAAVAKAQEKFAALSKELVENGKAFEANSKKIEEHRTTQIEASQETLDETTKNLAAEIRAVQASFAARAISQTEYNTRINTLFAEQANAKRAAYEEEVRINTAAKTDQDALVTKYGETKAGIEKELKEIGLLYVEVQKGTAGFVKSQGESATALKLSAGAATKATEEHAKAERGLATDAGNAATRVSELATKLGVAAGATVPLVTGLGNVTTALNAMKLAADAAADALDRVTGAAPGGGGGAPPGGGESVSV